MMTESGTLRYSLRQTPELLLWAMAISLAAHLIVFGAFEIGKKYHLWDRDFLPAWLRRVTHALTFVQTPKPRPPAQQEIPMMFVEVDPAAATPEAPAKATHYSSHNSRAANADTQMDSDVPKLTGDQTHVPKTETVPRTKMFPLQPSEPKRANPEDKTPESQPKGGQKVGDLAMAKPNPDANDPKETGDAVVQPHERPRTLAEARAQQAIPGDMMRQDGGVRRQRIVPSFDAIGTPFGEYDAEIIRAIQLHWYELGDAQPFNRAQTGRVVLQFRLNYDGRITDMTVIESSVDDIMTYLCERAVQDPAPYARWPSQMRQMIGADYREVRFTFFYD
jgi:hypothetical protein